MPVVNTDITEAIEAYEERLSKLEDAPVAERMKGETEAFEETTQELGDIYAENPNAKPQLGAVAKSISDISKTVTKSEAKEEVTRKAQRKRAKENGDDRTPLDEWVRENLDACRITRTTDHIDATTYAWDFGGLTVETEGGDGSRGHFNWVNFRDTIDESGGPYLAEPNDPYTDMVQWREFIVRQREKNEVVKTNVGPRTRAVQDLKNKVMRSDAFESLEAALNYDAVHAEVNNDPPEGADPVDTDTAPQRLPEWRVDKILIPNDWAAEVTEDKGVSTRALQNELDARGYTLPGHTRISIKKYVAGQQQRFWALTGDFANPNQYQPEGEEQTATDVGGEAVEDKQEIGGLSGESL